MDNEVISGAVKTTRDDFSFSDAEVYANAEGNICIEFDVNGSVKLTPIMAKRLSKEIEKAVCEAKNMILAE